MQTSLFCYLKRAGGLLKQGLIWRIGDRLIAKICVWGGGEATAKESELVDLDTRWWNLVLIKEIFNIEEAATISKLPLGSY
jgi:hypothetical protein